ncbi:MAG: hypothetical protein JZU52_17535, partial [Lamprocystis purpurea]|nr:hypothetical protein [Lamprocystis purpurea]
MIEEFTYETETETRYQTREYADDQQHRTIREHRVAGRIGAIEDTDIKAGHCGVDLGIDFRLLPALEEGREGLMQQLGLTVQFVGLDALQVQFEIPGLNRGY